MFKKNKELEKKVNDVFEAAAALDRGDSIGMLDIEKLTGVQRYSENWGALITKLKKRFLKERNIALWSVTNGSYKLLTSDEQIKLCPQKRRRKAIRQINRAVRENGAVPVGDLSLFQQQLRARNNQTLIQERRQLKRGNRGMLEEIKKTETAPRRPLCKSR